MWIFLFALGIPLIVSGTHSQLVNRAEIKLLSYQQKKSNLPKIYPLIRIHGLRNGSYEKIRGSELAVGTTNPEWVSVFWYIWKTGTNQKWKFDIRDLGNLDEYYSLGQAEVNVDDYVEKIENQIFPLSPQGTLTIQKTTPIRFKLSAKNIPKLDKLPYALERLLQTNYQAESDPYIKLYFRRGISGEDRKFATTSTKDNVVETDWEDEIEFGNYQKGTNMYLYFRMKDEDPGRDDPIGYALLELDAYVAANTSKTLEVKNEINECDNNNYAELLKFN